MMYFSVSVCLTGKMNTSVTQENDYDIRIRISKKQKRTASPGAGARLSHNAAGCVYDALGSINGKTENLKVLILLPLRLTSTNDVTRLSRDSKLEL